MRVTVNAPAKLNLALDIVGRRADGYHLLKMVTQSVDICDTVTVTSEDDDDVPIRLVCDDELPRDDSNTAVRAAKAFFEFNEMTSPGIAIKIKKKIPVSAGLGGGSADAAAVIVALDEMLCTRLSCDELCAIGEMVGADVPMCIVGGTALVEGTGTLINPLPDLPECFFVLAIGDTKTSTADMYARYDRLKEHPHVDTDCVVDAVCSGDLEAAAADFANVFEELWGNSKIPEIKKTMLRHGAIGSAITGSGPTVFGVFEEKADAAECAGILKKICDEVIICEPHRAGAEIQ